MSIHTPRHRWKSYSEEEVACFGCGIEPSHPQAKLTCPAGWPPALPDIKSQMERETSNG